MTNILLYLNNVFFFFVEASEIQVVIFREDSMKFETVKTIISYMNNFKRNWNLINLTLTVNLD
jgi:hypothetical protein